MRRLLFFAFVTSSVASGAALAADLRPTLEGPPPQAPTLEPWASGFYAHLGPGGLFMSESAKISAGGLRQPGANISIKPQYTAIVELGYYVTPAWAVSFTGGLPPVAKFNGAGALAGLGHLGSVRYGPTVLSAHYHFDFGAFRPYVGAGPTFMIVFGAKDGALSNLKVDNAVGFAGQIGAEYMLTKNVGVFVDVKKALLRTTGRGALGGAPIKANVTLDPLVVHTGLAYRF